MKELGLLRPLSKASEVFLTFNSFLIIDFYTQMVHLLCTSVPFRRKSEAVIMSSLLNNALYGEKHILFFHKNHK